MKPNAVDFSTNERPREYEVVFSVTGTVTRMIEADSKEDARRQAVAIMENEDEELIDIDCADEIDISHIRKSPIMYRVIRDGKNMQVSHLIDGDMPRAPDERGF